MTRSVGRFLASLLLLLAACTSGDAIVPIEPAEDGSPTVSVAPDGPSSADETDEGPLAVDATPAVEAVVEEVLVPSFTPMTLLTPASGEGTRPLLAWEPIEGAVHYAVTLFAPDGRPYWASLLIETQTYVGGPEQIAEGQAGPRVISGMTWMVIAYDDEQMPIAVSGERPVGP